MGPVLPLPDFLGIGAIAPYATCPGNWLGFFDRSQRFVTFLEHVKVDPVPVLEGAFAFLGVSTEPPRGSDVGAPVNASARVTMPAWARQYLERTLRPLDPRLETLLGQPLPCRDGGGA